MNEVERERAERRWDRDITRAETVEDLRRIANWLINAGKSEMAAVLTNAANEIVSLNRQCRNMGREMRMMKMQKDGTWK